MSKDTKTPCARRVRRHTSDAAQLFVFRSLARVGPEGCGLPAEKGEARIGHIPKYRHSRLLSISHAGMHAKKHKINFRRRTVKDKRTQGVIWIATSDDSMCPLSSRNITVNLSVAGS